MSKQRQVELLIEERIRAGYWKAHDRLPPERQMAQDFGVSRNTLRTALQSLQGRGVLGARQGSGNYVKATPYAHAYTDKENIARRLEGLVLLFPPVVALCAQQISPTELLELEHLLTPVGVAVQASSPHEFAAAQMAFVRAIVLRTGNGQIAAAFECLLPAGRLFSGTFSTMPPASWEQLFACLARLLGTLRRKEAENAAAIARDYTVFLLKSYHR